MKKNMIIWVILLLINTSAYAVTSNPNKMKAEVIFNKIEEVYSGFVYPHANTTSSDGFYSRSYKNSPVPYVHINMETGEIWYLWNNDWVYFLTLDEANEVLCNNLCFNDAHILSILPESSSDPEFSVAYTYAFSPAYATSHTISGLASYKKTGWWFSDPIVGNRIQVIFYKKEGLFLSNRVSKKIRTDSHGDYSVTCKNRNGRCEQANRVMFFYKEDGVSYCAGPYSLVKLVTAINITMKDCRL